MRKLHIKQLFIIVLSVHNLICLKNDPIQNYVDSIMAIIPDNIPPDEKTAFEFFRKCKFDHAIFPEDLRMIKF